VSKVKRIAKFDPDVKLVSNEGAVALTLSCEMFIKRLSERVYEQTRLSKKKTIQIRDFDACLQSSPEFSFLEGALETWSDVAGEPITKCRRTAVANKPGRNSPCSNLEDAPESTTDSTGKSASPETCSSLDRTAEPDGSKRQRLTSDRSTEEYQNTDKVTHQ